MRVFGKHIHNSDTPWRDAPSWAIELGVMNLIIIAFTEKEMAAIDDLNNAVTALATGFTALDAAVQNELAALIAAQQANNSAGITQAVANISAITGKMMTDAQALTASIPAATTAPTGAPLPDPTTVTPTVTPPQIATPKITAPSASPPSDPPASAFTV